MGTAANSQYSRVTIPAITDESAATSTINDNAPTIVFLNVVLNRSDHCAAANESTPMLKLLIATAAFNCSKSSNGKPRISPTLRGLSSEEYSCLGIRN